MITTVLLKLGEAGEFCVRHEGGLPLTSRSFLTLRVMLHCKKRCKYDCRRIPRIHPRYRGTPKSSILIGFSIHFWVPLFLETPICFTYIMLHILDGLAIVPSTKDSRIVI